MFPGRCVWSLVVFSWEQRIAQYKNDCTVTWSKATLLIYLGNMSFEEQGECGGAVGGKWVVFFVKGAVGAEPVVSCRLSTGRRLLVVLLTITAVWLNMWDRIKRGGRPFFDRFSSRVHLECVCVWLWKGRASAKNLWNSRAVWVTLKLCHNWVDNLDEFLVHTRSGIDSDLWHHGRSAAWPGQTESHEVNK